MAGSKRGLQNTFPRWMIMLGLVVFVPLAADFNARLTTIRQMRQEEAQLAQEIANERERRIALEATRVYVESDAYVEHWARVEARMARPGEVAVIPITQAQTYGMAALSSQSPLAASVSPLDEWWALFFETASMP